MKSNTLTFILGLTLFMGGLMSYMGNPVGDYISALSAIFLLANVRFAEI